MFWPRSWWLEFGPRQTYKPRRYRHGQVRVLLCFYPTLRKHVIHTTHLGSQYLLMSVFIHIVWMCKMYNKSSKSRIHVWYVSIFTYIYHQHQLNGGTSTIHGSYGVWEAHPQIHKHGSFLKIHRSLFNDQSVSLPKFHFLRVFTPNFPTYFQTFIGGLLAQNSMYNGRRAHAQYDKMTPHKIDVQ